MEELTLEQALQNIKIVLDSFRGTKQEHITLDESIQIIRNSICTCNKSKDKK